MKKPATGEPQAGILVVIALYHLELNQRDEAIKNLGLAIEQVELILGDVGIPEVKGHLISNVSQVYELQIRLLMENGDYSPGAGILRALPGKTFFSNPSARETSHQRFFPKAPWPAEKLYYQAE